MLPPSINRHIFLIMRTLFKWFLTNQTSKQDMLLVISITVSWYFSNP
jgi:hypothetical protein